MNSLRPIRSVFQVLKNLVALYVSYRGFNYQFINGNSTGKLGVMNHTLWVS